MRITEQQKIVAPSVNIDALITMLLFIKDKNPEVIEDIEDFEDVDFYNGVNLSRYISKNLPLFGLPKFDGIIEDLYGEFILKNIELIRNGETDKTKYTIPTLKKFEVLGEERYSGRKGDYYKLFLEGYSEEFITRQIERGEIDVSMGEFIEEEWGDTWDTERFVDEIKEVPMNTDTSYKTPSNNSLKEDVEIQPEIKSEDFMDFVNGEYDIETLELMQSVISGRVRKLKSLIDIANRKEIKGYRK
ncbi:hypothetical protein N9145_00835 [bacterium]|nr:hypothetical protein [bacterium]